MYTICYNKILISALSLIVYHMVHKYYILSLSKAKKKSAVNEYIITYILRCCTFVCSMPEIISFPIINNNLIRNTFYSGVIIHISWFEVYIENKRYFTLFYFN